MTLESAHGNYYEIRNILARAFVRANGDDDGKTIHMLDAAVKDVALAAAVATLRCLPEDGTVSDDVAAKLAELRAEIERRFGEGGKVGSGTGPCPSCLPGMTQCSGMDFSKEGTAMAQGSEARPT